MARSPLDPKDPRERLIIPTAIVVMGGWAAALVEALWRGNYDALTAVTPIMLLMCGYVFGISIVRNVRGRNGNGNGNGV